VGPQARFRETRRAQRLLGHSRQEILDEIAKCDLVCTNCHIIRTFARNGWGAEGIREDARPYEFDWPMALAV